MNEADLIAAAIGALVNAGAVDGVRLLRPDTFALMHTNRLTENQRAMAEIEGLSLFATGHGFGLGVAVVLEPEKAEPTLCGGGVGAVGWPGDQPEDCRNQGII